MVARSQEVRFGIFRCQLLVFKMSFAFIPNAVKKKKPVLVSSHAPSASISVGAQVTSESVDNSKGAKVFTCLHSVE